MGFAIPTIQNTKGKIVNTSKISTYTKCGNDVRQIADNLIELYYPAIKKYGVTIDYLFAHAAVDENGELKGDAIKLNGYPCSGLAHIIGLKDRVAGRADAEIIIDGDKWEFMPDDERAALVDHELNHFIVPINGHGIADTDDSGRPKLKMRKHDVQVGWFSIIAQRHALASSEVQQALGMVKNYRQSVFFFLNDAEDASSVE